MKNKSDITWHEACSILDQEHSNSAASRIYYAVFQAVYGYGLKTKKIDKNTISGLHKATHNIVRTVGAQSKRYGRIFSTLKGLRIRADYEREVVRVNEVTDLLKDAEAIRRFYIGKC